MRHDTIVKFPGNSAVPRKTNPASKDQLETGLAELCGYGKLRVSYTVSGTSERTVLNVRDTFVYEHRNRPSLCFRFHDLESPKHTARIHSCENLEQGPLPCVRVYLCQVQVRIGPVKRFLPVWFCDSEFDQRYLSLSPECLRKFSDCSEQHRPAGLNVVGMTSS